MKIRSDSIEHGKPIPAEFALGARDGNGGFGGNRNPQLAWTDVPAGVRSFALVCIDTDAPTDGALVANADVDIPLEHPRGDFVHWVVAAEEALPWAPGEFLAQYEQNRLSAIDDAIEADPIASAVMKLVQTEGNWSGTATELMQRLTLISPEEVKCSTRWPKQANTLSSKLKRCMTFLRERSVEIEFSKSGQRIITITSAFQKPVFAAAMNPVLLPDPMVQQAMAQVLMS